MVVNNNVYCLNERGAFKFIASRLAPTVTVFIQKVPKLVVG